MGTAAMSVIKLFDANGCDEVLNTHCLPSLKDKRMPFYPLHIQSRCAILMTNDLVFNQEKGVAVIHANLETIHNTPPQIDASAYSNVIIRSNAEAVGKRWKSWKPVLISKLLSASLSKKSVTGVVQTIRVESGRVSDLSEFRTSLCVIHAISICYSMVPPVVRHFLDHSVRESVRFSRLLSFKAENIQTYGHFVNSWTVFAAQRSEMRHCFEARTRFIAGADPKKAGSRPETRKSKKAKTEKSKIRKGSDKGAQEEKELKTE